jgi:hypothetical protein
MTETTINLRRHRIAEPRRVIAAMLAYWSHLPRSKHIAAIRRIRYAGTDWEDEGAFLSRCVTIALRTKATVLRPVSALPDYLAATREVQGR